MLFINPQKCATLTIMGSQTGGLEIQKITANNEVVNLSFFGRVQSLILTASNMLHP